MGALATFQLTNLYDTILPSTFCYFSLYPLSLDKMANSSGQRNNLRLSYGLQPLLIRTYRQMRIMRLNMTSIAFIISNIYFTIQRITPIPNMPGTTAFPG